MASKRIVIFNVNWLGDVLFSTAVIRNMRDNYPDSYIACVIPKRCNPVLEGNPYLNEIIIFDEKDTHKSPKAIFEFIRFLRSRKFDMAFFLHRSFSRALIAYMAGISERVGYYTKKRGFLLTKKIMPPDRDKMHRIDYYLNVIKSFGLNVKDRFSDFFVSADDQLFVDNFLKDHHIRKNDFLVGINPGGNWYPKRWPSEYFSILADKLIRDFGFKVIITGSEADIALNQQIKSLMEEKPISAAGAFNLKQMGALFERLDLFITADTGPLHIANSVGAKKIIALFGPTDVSVTGPYPADNCVIIQKNVGCKIPCYKVDCQTRRCMRAITPGDVLEQVKKIEWKK